VHGRNLVDVKKCNKKDTKLTHVWEFNGINSITKLIGSYNYMAKALLVLFAK
jgi:hypothetical protein